MKRRTFLKGLGASIALPALEAMLDSHGTAFAQGAPLPSRFLLFFFGNGVIVDKWVPQKLGAGWELTEELAPFAAVRDYVSVVSGYETKTPQEVPHHSGAAGILSGRPYLTLPAMNADFSSMLAGPSFDQLAVTDIGKTVFPSLQLAVSKRASVDEGPTLRYVSHQGPNAPLAPETNPAALFRRLFASFGTRDPLDPRDSLRTSVLDLVKGDLDALKPKLGANDKRRLDAHLTGISELRQQILALPPPASAACVAPGAVVDTNFDVNGVERLEDINRIMSSAAALAFACDLTRVISYQFNGAVGRTVFSDIGQTEVEHVLSHDGSAAAQAQIHQAVVFTMKNAAHLLATLKATLDPTGNLLDSACALLTSETAEGLSHAYADHPLLLAGKANGRLVHPGIHHRGASGNASDVVLAALRAVGSKLPAFGVGPAESTTPCAALLR